MGKLRAFLRNSYTDKHTLEFHATQLFGAKQGKCGSISKWIRNVQRLSSKFREAALQDCEDDDRVGIVALADKFVKDGSNMTGTDFCVNKPHYAAAVRP